MPTEHQEALHCAGDRAPAQVAYTGHGVSLLVIFQSQLDVVLVSPLWVTPAGAGAGVGGLQRCFSIPTMLEPCESLSGAQLMLIFSALLSSKPGSSLRAPASFCSLLRPSAAWLSSLHQSLLLIPQYLGRCYASPRPEPFHFLLL